MLTYLLLNFNDFSKMSVNMTQGGFTQLNKTHNRRTWLRSCTPILDVNMEKDDKARFMKADADH